jgi:muramoyltetrapeptide carboxypeptidase LdcA involved in peptidoglycan recycling
MAMLESLGYQAVGGEHAFGNDGWVSAPVADRVADLHGMFADPEVRMILATIGGDHACHLLPHLDWDLIRANPKIVMGFSDTSVLTNAILKETGLVTFNGPALMTDWAEYPVMPAWSRDIALGVLNRAIPFGRVTPSPWWTEEFLDWATGEDEQRPRHRTPSTGWRWLREGTSEGPVVGGCLESLQHLRGTRWWPDLDGAILFLETSELKPSPATVDALLMDFENMGTFDRIVGMIVARPYGYSDADRLLMHDVVLRRTERWGFPILADIDAGHTSPIMTLPLGCQVRLDARLEGFEIVEAAVS